MNKKYIVYVVIFLAGVMLADKVKTLPGVNKLPTF